MTWCHVLDFMLKTRAGKIRMMRVHDVARNCKTVVDGQYIDERVMPFVLAHVNHSYGIPELGFAVKRSINV
jgi:hypothetical protein